MSRSRIFVDPPPASGMKVVVSGLHVSVANPDRSASRDQPRRILLRDVGFVAQPGDVVALMGPSGAGKTTLLNRLVGRGIAGEVKGSISYDGRTISEARSSIGYVTQDDIMLEALTPRENLHFAAAFQQCGRNSAERAEAVEATLRRLRIQGCADTVVGIPGLVKGISGGERKRTNVGLALLNKPRLLFLDEPTSGLDAKLSEQLIADVGEVAKQGCTVVATIHQPSDAVFSHFTKVLLLESGRVAFYGPTAGLLDTLHAIGFDIWARNGVHLPLPELLLEVLQMPTDKGQVDQHARRLDDLRSKSLSGAEDSGEHTIELALPPFKPAGRLNFWRSLIVLLRREFLHFRRNQAVTVVRTAQTLSATIVTAWIFSQVGSNLAGVKARLVGVFILIFPTLYFPMMGVVNTFPAERAVFFREVQDRWYRPPAFFIAKVMFDSIVQCFHPLLTTAIGYPILGLNSSSIDRIIIFYIFCVILSNAGAAMGFFVSAGVSSVSTAVSIAPGLVMPQLLLCGVFLRIDLLPQPFRSMSGIVVMRYALQGILTNEFTCDPSPLCTEHFRLVSGAACATSPCDFCCEAREAEMSGGVCPVLTCDEALRSLGLGAAEIWPSGATRAETLGYNILASVVIVVCFRAAAMAVLDVSYRFAATRG